MKHEAQEILDKLYQEDKIPYVEYSRLYDLVECLAGDVETQAEMINNFLLKINGLKEILE